MKKHNLTILWSSLLLLLPLGLKAQGYVKSVKMDGFIGQRIDACIEGRVKPQDANELVRQFKQQKETSLWQSEFWGKWVQGAIDSYRYCHDKGLYEKIRQSVDGIIQCQLPNGYIGNYAESARQTNWDIWGNKYTTLGLLAWYRLSGDKRALKAASRLIDYVMSCVGDGKKAISTTGLYRGMPSLSILEPVTYLYRYTHDKKYLDFATYIASQMEAGPHLISYADHPVAQRWPLHKGDSWWSFANGQKAYEMMSCYEGLVELWKLTGDSNYLHVAETTFRHIVAEEINIAGAGASKECWYGGKALQTRPAFDMMETCVTFTWMQFCNRLLEVTDNTEYADCVEHTLYNALFAAMKGDGTNIAKYTPLQGFRHEGEDQCGVHINCCNANGPRAFALIPHVAYQTRKGAAIVNLYGPSTADIALRKGLDVRLSQTTDYPLSGHVSLRVDPQRAAAFTLKLRIPGWSSHTEVSVNGQPVDGVAKGTYCSIERTWQPGDVVTVDFDMACHLVQLNNMQAVTRGPIVFARDSRFQDGSVDEVVVIRHDNGTVQAQCAPGTFSWLQLTLPAQKSIFTHPFSSPQEVHLCDFASACNDWSLDTRYRVWLPKTLDVQTLE